MNLLRKLLTPLIISKSRCYSTNGIVSRKCFLNYYSGHKPSNVVLKNVSTSPYCSSTIENEIIDFDDYESSNYNNIDFEEIAKGDPEKIKLLKLMQLEVEVMYQQGERVPSCLNHEQWIELLLCPTKSNRIKYLNFLWLNEIKKLSKKRRQEEDRVIFEMKKKDRDLKQVEPDVIEYGLARNCLFHRLYDTQIHKLYNYRNLQSLMFGIDIVIDCGYENFMSRKEISMTSKQLMLLWGENRVFNEPFNLVFCNANRESEMLQRFNKLVPNMYDPDFPGIFTEKNYLDLYPKSRLVYLTPHCKEELFYFNPDDIYIIGAVVDKSHNEPLSLAKAKKDGIRMTKFPLDRYLQWGCGLKSLTLNQCISIMNELKTHNNWKEALKHVPKRKLAKDPIDEYESEKNEEKVSIKSIRDHYRRNMVYELLLKNRLENEK